MHARPADRRSHVLRRAGGRLALLAAGLLAAAAIGEGIVRVARPGEYAPPTLRMPDGRVLGSLYEIIGLLRQVSESTGAGGSLTRLAPDVRVLCCYDRPRWDYFEDGCIEYATNALGFRDLPFTREKRAGERRILAIGDSFTFGVGVRLEDCWTQVLERDLESLTGGDVEVVNAGFAAGYLPEHYAAWLPRGLELEPDVVIVGFCLNDMGRIPMVVRPPEEPPWLGGRWQTLVLLQRAVQRPGAVPAGLDFAAVVRAEPATWQRQQAALVDMQRTLQARGIRLLVAVFPMLSDLRGAYPFRTLHAMVREFGAAHGIEVVDLLERFRGRDERELWVHPTDQHPNDAGNRLIATGLVERLRP